MSELNQPSACVREGGGAVSRMLVSTHKPVSEPRDRSDGDNAAGSCFDTFVILTVCISGLCSG